MRSHVYIILTLFHASSQQSYSSATLALRLRRLEEENVALLKELGEARRALPNCTAFVQTAGCDPDGDIEKRLGCDFVVQHGASGFCECRGGARAGEMGCQHGPIRCDDVCSDLLAGPYDSNCADADENCGSWARAGECERNADFMRGSCRASCHECNGRKPTRSVSVGVTSTGQQQLTTRVEEAGTECSGLRGCRACAAVPNCAWCLQTRRCVNDEPWICQGEEDHVSEPSGVPQPGKPGRARCPTAPELEEKRKARNERERAAAKRSAQQPRTPLSPQPDDGRDELDDARARARQRVVRASLDEVQRLREEEGAAAAETDVAAAAAAEAEAKAEAESKAEAHLAELQRRVAMAEDEEGGADRPYETLGLPPNCTQSEVKKVSASPDG